MFHRAQASAAPGTGSRTHRQSGEGLAMARDSTTWEGGQLNDVPVQYPYLGRCTVDYPYTHEDPKQAFARNE